MARRPASVLISIDRVSETLKAIRGLHAQKVMVGVPPDSPPRTPDKGETRAPSNAMIWYIAENGSPINNIPARPILRPAINRVKRGLLSALTAAGKAELDGDDGLAGRHYERAGALARDAIQGYILMGSFVPLKPSTIANRRQKGRAGTKPLVDTRQFLNAVTFVVRKR